MRLDGLLKMDYNTARAKLQQFMYALEWIKTVLQKISKMAVEIITILEILYSAAVNLNKRAA